MGRKTLILLGVLLFSSVTFAQAELDLTFTKTEISDSIEYTLVENQLKLYASEVDLETLQIHSLKNENTPDLIMPTAHAKVYAIIDFSNCAAGTYLINGFKGQKELYFTIIFNKD